MDRNVILGVFDQARIERIASETRKRTEARKGNDFVIPRERLTVTTLDDESTLAVTFDVDGDRKLIPVKRSALHQMAGSLRVPTTYLDRLLQAGHPDLAAMSLDTIMSRETKTDGGKPKKHLVRSLYGEVDAFLSDSYRAIANDAVLAVALEALEEAGAQVWDLRLTDTDFKILAAAPHISGKVTTDRNFSGMSRWEGKEGDVLNAALTITNSETGHARFAASSAILRRVCQNFNIWADVVTRRHIGSKLQEGEQDWTSDETKQLEDAALVSKLKDAIKSTFDAKRFQETIDAINQTTTRELGEKPTLVVDAAVKLFGLTETRKESIIERLFRSGDKSQYGLVQAITATVNPENAGDLDDASRSSFEEAGGTLLRLSERDWKAFVKKAHETKGQDEVKAVQTVSVRS